MNVPGPRCPTCGQPTQVFLPQCPVVWPMPAAWGGALPLTFDGTGVIPLTFDGVGGAAPLVFDTYGNYRSNGQYVFNTYPVNAAAGAAACSTVGCTHTVTTCAATP